ncbi:large subunit ribosomal protein L25 [Dehalogenimonas formicexedens]|uniref:Large ribosomal subunit protein bL25 n=1 Tax=Dehalogenimonas formicexedens TaxID=1839801 RepID=A0A1P8FAE1_9CHLR|nr:50S ribosomal protein L25 [Dehalogenimonas formicexedens]APV45436.1 large subunit ribosomal protein L25 [Dehalogenimonas formicexedens]
MDKIAVKLSPRTVTGKKTRFLRRAGVTPCHVFGHNLASQTLQAATADLERVVAQAGSTRLVALQEEGEKKPRMAFIREVQRTPVGGGLFHVDFYQVNMNEPITAEIPLRLVGEAPALKTKGRILVHPMAHVEVESLPGDLPASITVDISVLNELHDAIHVRDLKVEAEVTILSDPDQLIAKVSEITVKAEEVTTAPVAATAPGAEGAAPAEAAAPAAAEAK